MTKKTLEELQEDHSEMIATAADLGMTVPKDLTIDFDNVEVGATVCSNLDALIRKFRAGIDASDEEGNDDDGDDDRSDGDEDDDSDAGDEDAEDDDEAAPEAKEDDVKVLAKKPRRAKGGSEGKKSGGKKSPSKSTKTDAAAQGEVDAGESQVADNVSNDKAKAKEAAAAAKAKAAAAKAKEREKAAAAKAKEKAAREKVKAKEQAAKEKAKAAAAKAKEKAAAAKAKAKAAVGKGKVAAAKSSEGGVKRSRAAFDDSATIHWGSKGNPAREGAGRHERIAQVIKFSGKTVKAFLAAGGNPTTLKNCVTAKLCTVA